MNFPSFLLHARLMKLRDHLLLVTDTTDPSWPDAIVRHEVS